MVFLLKTRIEISLVRRLFSPVTVGLLALLT